MSQDATAARHHRLSTILLLSGWPAIRLQANGSEIDDPNGWAFTHDATTLGGSSGSLILSLHGGMPLCGLHFGGETLAANYAHDIEAIRALGDGVFNTRLLPKSQG